MTSATRSQMADVNFSHLEEKAHAGKATELAQVLVLGLGNDILTDDAVGLRIVHEVSSRLADEPRIEVKATTEMGLALLDEIVGRASLVLVDSIQTGKVPPGHIYELSTENFSSLLTTTPHFLGVGETLALGGILGLAMPRRVRVFAIEVEDPFTLGTNLSPAVQKAVPTAADRVIERAREFART